MSVFKQHFIESKKKNIIYMVLIFTGGVKDGTFHVFSIERYQSIVRVGLCVHNAMLR